MLKNILAIIAGYLIFAVSSVMLFKLTGQPPHQEASLIFKIMTVCYGIVFSIIGGFVTNLIARNTKANIALAILIFTGALISMLTSGGAHWTQWFAMLIFAPVSVAGGYLKRKRAAA